MTTKHKTPSFPLDNWDKFWAAAALIPLYIALICYYKFDIRVDDFDNIIYGSGMGYALLLIMTPYNSRLDRLNVNILVLCICLLYTATYYIMSPCPPELLTIRKTCILSCLKTPLIAFIYIHLARQVFMILVGTPPITSRGIDVGDYDEHQKRKVDWNDVTFSIVNIIMVYFIVTANM